MFWTKKTVNKNKSFFNKTRGYMSKYIKSEILISLLGKYWEINIDKVNSLRDQPITRSLGGLVVYIELNIKRKT